MKTVLLVVALAFNMMTCDFLNTYNLNDNRQGGGSVTGPGNVCEGLVASLNVDSESGSSVKQGFTITFSADPRDAGGNSVPGTCRQGAVVATPVGECVLANSLAPTLDVIEMYAANPGECKARVTFAGVTGISGAVTIVP